MAATEPVYPMRVVDFLKTGDCLLYQPQGFWGRLIALKTWHNVSHCEAYWKGPWSVGSREGRGVDAYFTRLDDSLVFILRPLFIIDEQKASAWFETVKGQKYDWLGLLRFAWFKSIGTGNNGRMFCSEFLTRWYRAGGIEPFHPREDADAIVPADFLQSPVFDHYVVRHGLVYPEGVAA